MQDNDADAETIRGYLLALLRQLWEHGEAFGGKRPFGNSGWEYELYEPLARAGLIEATFDEDGYFDTCDNHAGHELIAQAITALGTTGQAA
ncbi:hypothetical protein ACFXG4_04095 [Nocardia sp. NPDC059246]|uniref:hypothetical protein n=1 Tax=unclassified Nocardia TaxID=2637762 RepID=UPI0036841D4B